jgi:DNA repair protein RecO (recombination protein O)
VLQEAVLRQPFPSLSSDFLKAAYASYWAELIHDWAEESAHDRDLYHLFHYVLAGLDAGRLAESALSILFQVRFIAIAGYTPNLTGCILCKKGLDEAVSRRAIFSIRRGGMICDRCDSQSQGRLVLSKGTIKQLLWLGSGDLGKAAKIRLGPSAIHESTVFLESFVPYHLGREPRSLAFLRQIRTEAALPQPTSGR